MGRGESNTNSSAVAMAGRYDLMPQHADEPMLDGRPWEDHIAAVKAARLIMINILDALDPAGLTTEELRMRAASAGAQKDDIVLAQVQLIRQGVIEKNPADETWHLTTDAHLVSEWREHST